MSLSCGFFNSEDGDRQYFNQDLSSFLEGLIEDGIYEFIDDKMMVSASATPDMHVLIGKGRAWFNGTWTKIDSAYQIEIPAADSIQNRIDAICLTVNKTRAVRDNYIEIISGTGTVDTPTKPVVQDETDIYRHVLAYVTVMKGVTEITQASIENRVGMGSALFSYPKWGDVPTTEDMVAQWQTQFDEFMDHIHETFDYDAAGNLQIGVENLAPDLTTGGPFVDGDFALDHNVLKKKAEGLWIPRKVSEEILDMKSTFQDGVDAVYNACIEAGIMPSSSTPEGIATALIEAANGTALPADIVAGKTALAGKAQITGTRKATNTYTFPSGDTGGTKDLGEQNLYRYVNASNVYNKGVAVGQGSVRYRFDTVGSSYSDMPSGSAGGTFFQNYTCPSDGYYLQVGAAALRNGLCVAQGIDWHYIGPVSGSAAKQVEIQRTSTTGLFINASVIWASAGTVLRYGGAGATMVTYFSRLNP